MDQIETLLAKRAIVDTGDNRRLLQAMRKAHAGERLTIGYIGGSITEGAIASTRSRSYAGLTTAWWQEKFPMAEIRHVNAGIGATGTYIAVHRVREDLLGFRPDVVVVEFAANDELSPQLTRQYEGLLRAILQSDNQPAVLLMFMMDKSGSNVQEAHAEVGFHYRLPMISLRDAVFPAVKEGSILWESLYADEVHPNDDGHRLVSRILISQLERAYEEASPGWAAVPTGEFPAPLTAEGYGDAKLYRYDDLAAASNTGWSKYDAPIFKPAWQATEPGAEMSFEVSGRNIGIIYSKLSNGRMGRASVQVDDGPRVVLEGHFTADWEGYPAAQLLAYDLADEPHFLRISFLPEHHEASSGSEFVICGILSAR